MDACTFVNPVTILSCENWHNLAIPNMKLSHTNKYSTITVIGSVEQVYIHYYI